MRCEDRRPAPAVTGSGPEYGSQGSNRGSENTRDVAEVQGGLAIYDGRMLLGWLVFRRDGRIDVVAARGQALGRYNDRRAACVALVEHARRGAAR